MAIMGIIYFPLILQVIKTYLYTNSIASQNIAVSSCIYNEFVILQYETFSLMSMFQGLKMFYLTIVLIAFLETRTQSRFGFKSLCFLKLPEYRTSLLPSFLWSTIQLNLLCIFFRFPSHPVVPWSARRSLWVTPETT